MKQDHTGIEALRQRLQNALWGLFIADALAMPAHWYYNINNISEVFNGGIRSYADPPHPHLESFMVGMGYHPDVETAKRLGRSYDILHEHARFYHTSYGQLQIGVTQRENEHGNAVAQLEQRYHYHHGLMAGENTLAAQLIRVLLRAVIRLGRYNPNTFLEDFIEYLITPGNIPHQEMWQIHTALSEAPFEIDRLVKERSETEVVKQFLSTACYPEHGLPLLLYFAQNHNVDVEAALLANANAGGDNVHRGMVLGLIVGAANDELPEHLIKGLLARDELKNEIEAFADIVLSGQGI